MQYQTKDINQAAFLWTLPGAKQVGEILKERSVFFELDLPGVTDEQLNQALMDFRNGQTSVEPLSFCAKQDQLRQIVRNLVRRK